MENITVLLKGKPIADKNLQHCLSLAQNATEKPHMHLILCGNDPASEYYVSNIQKQCEKYLCRLTVSRFDNVTQNQLINEIEKLNNDPDVHGIMIQKPLPHSIDTSVIEQAISPTKDIDGLHPLNAGLLLAEKKCFLPCTAQAIIELMDFYDISAEGKHVVVIGRSNVVGKPVANLLLYKQKNRNATITVCHSRTPDLAKYTVNADILIVAVGVPNIIKARMLPEGAVVIDAGINEISDDNGKVKYTGDVDFDDCLPKCSAITPVPGGVGSITTSILFKHLWEAV